MAEYLREWVRESETVRPLLDGIPVLPTTRAALEYLLRTTPIDLRGVAEEVESDLGFSARVLMTALVEFDSPPERCPALEECIAMLGADSLRDMVRSVPAIDRTSQVCECLNEIAQESRRVASLSKAIAVACDYPAPVQAYWAGLFHDLGKVPILFQSYCSCRQENTERARRIIGTAVAYTWSLPLFISDVIQHVATPQLARDPLLAAIVAFAREESRKPSCPKEYGRKRKEYGRNRTCAISREGCA